MESAARTQWRAAAWLLERTKPETYARKRGDLASGIKVAKALRLMMETALANTAPEARTELFKHLDKTYEHALDCCFPSLGPWDRPRNPQMADSPLVWHEQTKAAPVIRSTSIGTPEDWPMLQKPRSHAPRGNATSDAPRHEPNEFASPVPPPPEPPLAPDSSNRGQATPPPITEFERAQRHQDLLDWGFRLMRNE